MDSNASCGDCTRPPTAFFVRAGAGVGVGIGDDNGDDGDDGDDGDEADFTELRGFSIHIDDEKDDAVANWTLSFLI